MPDDNKVSSEGIMEQPQASTNKDDTEEVDSSDEEVCDKDDHLVVW